MINYERVAEKIFSIIKGHGHTLSMYKEDGMDTTDAAEARRFFVAKPNYMITLDEDTSTIKINKNSDLELEDLEGILKQMKNLARENMLNTQVKVFGKEITPKDFAYQAKKFKDKQMSGISEASLSRMSGSKKTSYQTLESVKMIVRHRKAVDEDVRGSRSRQIKAIFLEQGGERFRFPHNHLAGARAMARHMYEGGKMQDTIGEYIVESVSNLIQLAEFVRYTRTNKLINETSEDVIKIVKENIAALRGELKGLTGAKSYAKVSETIATREADVLEEDDTDLQDMFTVRKFDEKFGATLPLVSRLLSEKQAWRAALLEASQQTIFMKEKEDLAEEDIMEFENPAQQVGYKIGKVAKRMVESGDLSKFVAKVAGKLIEGSKISEFEQTIVRNVMENAKIEEDKDACRFCDGLGTNDDGDPCDSCNGSMTENAVESVGDAYELKLKMIEHEEIFSEAEAVKTACSKCNGTGREPGESDGRFDRKMFSAVSCKACGGYGYGLSGDPARGLGKVTEEEGEKCIRCRKGTMRRGDTMMGPAKECDRCLYQIPIREVDEADFDDHHAGEIEAGAHSGMPSNDLPPKEDYSDIVDLVVDDVMWDEEGEIGPDEVLKLVAHYFKGDEYDSPAIDDVYQQVLDRLSWTEESLNELRKAAGIPIKENNKDECDKCYGLGRKPSGGADCEECGGTGNCPLSENTCKKCDGRGYDDEDDMGLCSYCDGSGKKAPPKKYS